MNITPQADRLWRAYYDHAENGVALKDAVAQLEANQSDLEYIIEQIGAEKGHDYIMKPTDYPIVQQKKRGRKAKGSEGESS